MRRVIPEEKLSFVELVPNEVGSFLLLGDSILTWVVLPRDLHSRASPSQHGLCTALVRLERALHEVVWEFQCECTRSLQGTNSCDLFYPAANLV